MRTQDVCGAAFATVLLGPLVGCTRAVPEFPAGAWWLADPEAGAPIVLLFDADGTVMGNLGEAGQDPATVEVADSPAGEVTWSATGDVLSLTAPCYDRATDTVDQRTTTYRWALEGDQLTMTVIEHPCPDEEGVALNGLTRLATTPRVKGAHVDPVAEPVPWWNDEVFYEVFVRSFADSDGDGNGDLRGLIEKLPYLDDLGVTALWLMPIMASPSYHGYDITNYYTVESDYGTNQDFKDLVSAAHARGIQVIVDLVLNHTSSEHPWFVESASSPASPKRDWYVWRADDPGTVSFFTGGPAWHPRSGAYYFGFFSEIAPDLNYRNPEVTAQMEDAARFWLQDMGADGFRMDSIAHLIEDGDQAVGTQQTHDWLAAWDDYLDSVDPQALTVGEVFDTTQIIAPYVTGDETDLVFEFTLAEQLLASVDQSDPSLFARQLRTVLAAYPPGQFAPFLTNHDQNRVMARLAGDLAKAKLAASALLTLPGVPFVYYGEEVGMTGRKPDEMIRTPMQWDATAGAGFTTGTPWEPINADHTTVNVAAQLADPASLLNHYRRLLDLRAAHPALSVGGLDLLTSTCDSVLAFLRRSADGTDTILAVHNFGAAEATGCALSTTSSALPEASLRATDLLTGTRAEDLKTASGGAVNDYTPLTTLPPRSTAVLHLTG